MPNNSVSHLTEFLSLFDVVKMHAHVPYLSVALRASIGRAGHQNADFAIEVLLVFYRC